MTAAIAMAEQVSSSVLGQVLERAADPEQWERFELLDRARIEYATFRERYAELAGADRLQDAIGSLEAAASRIAHYEPLIVPGILQTADYTRELLHLPSGPAQSGATDEEISRMIASRLRRQAILYEAGRDITILIGEAALRTQIAPPPIMRAQREHIARLAETLTTATIGIVPFTAKRRSPPSTAGSSPTISPPSKPTPATLRSPTPTTCGATGTTHVSYSTRPAPGPTPPPSAETSTSRPQALRHPFRPSVKHQPRQIRQASGGT